MLAVGYCVSPCFSVRGGGGGVGIAYSRSWIEESTKYCTRRKEKVKIYKIKEESTEYCRRKKEKVKIFKIEEESTKSCRTKVLNLVELINLWDSGTTLGSLWNHSGITLGSLWDQSGISAKTQHFAQPLSLWKNTAKLYSDALV